MKEVMGAIGILGLVLLITLFIASLSTEKRLAEIKQQLNRIEARPINAKATNSTGSWWTYRNGRWENYQTNVLYPVKPEGNP